MMDRYVNKQVARYTEDVDYRCCQYEEAGFMYGYDVHLSKHLLECKFLFSIVRIQLPYERLISSPQC